MSIVSPAPIIIDLSQPTDVFHFVNKAELIQQEALNHFRELFAAFLKESESYSREVDRKRVQENRGKSSFVHRVHNAIAVHSSRGSGKTTFILNLFEDINENHGADVEILRIVDPTLIESKENILVTIIAQITKCCDDYFNHAKSRGAEDSGKKRVSWREALGKLAGGLSLLDGVGSERAYGSDWDDPQHILNHGLQRARSGAQLEELFHDFIRVSLEMLNKTAFMLAFDDIDTKFERGWPVLETIRKYLTTPQLILLISGDFGLYSQLVRREQFMNLGGVLLQNDRPHTDFHDSASIPPWSGDVMVKTVDRLEEQYLQKILKPENRITLSTLAELDQANPRRYQIQVKSQGQPTLDLSAYLERVLTKLIFVSDSGDHALYRAAILSQPLRTVMQFLKAGEALSADGEVSDAALDRFRRSLPNIFASALYHQRLDPIAIGSGDPEALIAQLIQWSEFSDGWETTYRLRPEYAESDKNLAAIVFASQFAKVTYRAPEQALVFMIKLGLAREFMLERGHVKSRDVIRALGLDMREKPTTVARRAVTVQRALSGRPSGLDRGTISVTGAKIDIPNMLKHLYFGNAQKGSTSELANAFRKKRPEIDAAANGDFQRRPILAWWKEATKQWSDTGMPWRGYVYNTLTSLPQKFDRARLIYLAASIMVSPRLQDRAHLSIFPLVATLAELLELGHRPTPITADELRAHVARLTQLRSYPAPQFSNEDYRGRRPSSGPELVPMEETGAVSDDTMGSEASDDETQNLNGLMQALVSWIQSAEAIELTLPPSVYSRMATRLYYTLTRMDDEITAGERPLSLYTGILLHRQIIALFNSVLVEEMLAKNIKRKIGAKQRPSDKSAAVSGDTETRLGFDLGEPILDNPTTGDTPFWQNFPFAEPAGTTSDREERTVMDFTGLPLFRLIFSCPLWGCFLMPETVVFRGNRATQWDLLNLHLRCWAPNTPEEDGLEARKDCIRITDGKMNFPNLWAPLNSIPVLKSQPMPFVAWDEKASDTTDRLGPEREKSKPVGRPRGSKKPALFGPDGIAANLSATANTPPAEGADDPVGSATNVGD